MDKVQEICSFKYNLPSSEVFRTDLCEILFILRRLGVDNSRMYLITVPLVPHGNVDKRAPRVISVLTRDEKSAAHSRRLRPRGQVPGAH